MTDAPTPDADDATEADLAPDIVQSGGLPDSGLLSGGLHGDEDAEGIAGLLGNAGLDFGALMEQASAMQAQMVTAQQQAAETMLEGVAGGGAVRVVTTGTLDIQSVTIDPAAANGEDIEMLQDLILTAVRDAIDQCNQLQQGSLDLDGLGLGDIAGFAPAVPDTDYVTDQNPAGSGPEGQVTT